MFFIFLSDFYSNLVCIAQAFEWAIMINMIVYQNGKTLSEIMHLMSEHQSRKAFRVIETKIQITYYFVASLILIEQCLNMIQSTVYNNAPDYKKAMNLILAVKYCFIIATLFSLGSYLLYMLKTKYYFAY